MGIVRQHHNGGSSRSPADLAPGELVWANIINGLENSRATGKARPVVLIEARGSAWKTMGLTTNPRYRDGSPRIAIPDPMAVGLKGQGWLWSDKLPWTAGIDIEDHIGWVDEGLAFEIIELADIRGPVIRDMLAAARDHHRGPDRTDLSLVRGRRT
jgi:hypothetical protein